MQIRFQLEFSACLFGVAFDDTNHAFLIFLGPLIIGFEWIGDDDEVIHA